MSVLGVLDTAETHAKAARHLVFEADFAEVWLLVFWPGSDGLCHCFHHRAGAADSDIVICPALESSVHRDESLLAVDTVNGAAVFGGDKHLAGLEEIVHEHKVTCGSATEQEGHIRSVSLEHLAEFEERSNADTATDEQVLALMVDGEAIAKRINNINNVTFLGKGKMVGAIACTLD